MFYLSLLQHPPHQFRYIVFALLIALPLFTPAPVASKYDCEQIITDALIATSEQCLDLGRDSLCYGHVRVDLEAQEGATIAFDKPGDKVSARDISAITLAAMDGETGDWGVAYMRIRANLPDVAAGQFVTLLLFGDSELTVKGESEAPLTSIYLKTGIAGGQPICERYAPDGLIIQTPTHKTAPVLMAINDVQVSLTSTAFVRTRLFDGAPHLAFQTFEGSLDITAAGKSDYSMPGKQINVPLDSSYMASGAPFPPKMEDTDGHYLMRDMLLYGYKFKLFAFEPGVLEKALGSNGRSSSGSVDVRVSHSTTSREPGTVRFRNESTPKDPANPIKSHLWDFGDGATGEGAEVSHTYAADGTYSVRLDMYMADETKSTITFKVEIKGVPGSAVTFPPDAKYCLTTIKGSGNIRSAPVIADNVVDKSVPGTELRLIGKDAAGEWFQFERVDKSLAWINMILIGTPVCPAGFTLPEVKP